MTIKTAIRILPKSFTDFGQTILEQVIARTANSTFAIGGVSCSEDSFVVTESSVLRMNIWRLNSARRQPRERQTV
jgi:hypothetical protein